MFPAPAVNFSEVETAGESLDSRSGLRRSIMVLRIRVLRRILRRLPGRGRIRAQFFAPSRHADQQLVAVGKTLPQTYAMSIQLPARNLLDMVIKIQVIVANATHFSLGTPRARPHAKGSRGRWRRTLHRGHSHASGTVAGICRCVGCENRSRRRASKGPNFGNNRWGNRSR